MRDLTRKAITLGANERFALMQLCSTAYLASGSLDANACGALVRVKLATQDPDGYWGATDEGRDCFASLEAERRQE